MKLRWRAVMMLIATTAISEVWASEPISFLGIHWQMPLPMMTQILDEGGYDCETVEDELLGHYKRCVKGVETIEILERFGVIELNCHTHGACDLSQSEVVERLIARNVIDGAEPAGNDYYGALLYCSDGGLGDALCVDSASSVILYRARLEASQ